MADRTAAAQRRTQRAERRGVRTGRLRLRPQRSTLGRNYTQDQKTGRMSGSTTTPAPKLRKWRVKHCPWCRGTGSRPVCAGTGSHKTVHGVIACDHRWSVRDGGPGAKAPDPHDILRCRQCDTSGFITYTATPANGAAFQVKKQCPVCLGWAPVWNMPWVKRRKYLKKHVEQR